MADTPPAEPVLDRLRSATGSQHQRLETRLGAIRRFSEPDLRAALIRRYAAFHLAADDALAGALTNIPALDYASRRRGAFFATYAKDVTQPAFPEPRSLAQALGMLYVIEGSTLGGRTILRALAKCGIHASELAFLDPYGPETGARWRAFLQVLSREVRTHEDVCAACEGAILAFGHAENVLCGDL